MTTSASAVPAGVSSIRTFYWCVRRELWEHRWLYVAPLAIAAALLTACAVAAVVRAPGARGNVIYLELVGRMILLTGFMVAFLYCFDALHGERRDRSILFWKALPVSDVITILSKAAIPLIVVPLVTCAILLAVYVPLVLNAATSPTRWLFAPMAGILWHAPLYAWGLLVSGIAKRAPIAWAVLPLIALGVIGRIVFGSSHASTILMSHGPGAYWQPFAASGQPASIGEVLGRPISGALFAGPEMWIGVAIAGALLAAAVRLRLPQVGSLSRRRSTHM